MFGMSSSTSIRAGNNDAVLPGPITPAGVASESKAATLSSPAPTVPAGMVVVVVEMFHDAEFDGSGLGGAGRPGDA
jgi:hypothetical protein